jgi:hypothetical protein
MGEPAAAASVTPLFSAGQIAEKIDVRAPDEGTRSS